MTIVSSIVIICSTITVAYVVIKVLSFRHRIFQFFEMLTREQVEFLESSAANYVLFVETGNNLFLMQADKKAQDFKKTQNLKTNPFANE